MESLAHFIEASPHEWIYLLLFTYVLISTLGFATGVVDISLLASGVLCRKGIILYCYAMPIALIAVFMGETVLFILANTLGAKVLSTRFVKDKHRERIDSRVSLIKDQHLLKGLVILRVLPTLKAVCFFCVSGLSLNRSTYFGKYTLISAAYSFLLISLPQFV